MENKGLCFLLFLLLSSWIHFPKHPDASFSSFGLFKDFYSVRWELGTHSNINSLLSSEVKKRDIGTALLFDSSCSYCCFFLLFVFVCSVLFLCTSLFPFSRLALAIRDQEYHGFLFANVGHDRGQLVDVAAVEMLCLPQVQDHRGWARFGCKETHVSLKLKSLC